MFLFKRDRRNRPIVTVNVLMSHHSDAIIEAIVGGNFRRVLKEIWTV